jgi:hypothetical protein
MTLVAGKNRVPKPAQGKTQVRNGFMAGGEYRTRAAAALLAVPQRRTVC